MWRMLMDKNYEEFKKKYLESPNTISHHLLEKARAIAPKDDSSGSSRDEIPEENYRGISSVHNQSHESVIVKTDALNKVVMYRDIARYPEVSNVVDQIVNDSIIYDENGDSVFLQLDKTDFSEQIKRKILEEFEEVQRLLNSNTELKKHFRDWYIDSKLYFENVFDDEEDNGRIVELRKLDPVSVVPKIIDITETDTDGNKYYVGSDLFFEYNTNMSYMTNRQQMSYGSSMFSGYNQRILNKDQITYAHSGITDCKGLNKGHLHQAVKPAHTLKMIEDAIIIFRITKSPDRKVFYIDTGALPPSKAEDMMRKVMAQNSKRYSFDSDSGKLSTKNGSPLMTDDFYLQRSNGIAVTEVQPLSGATGMNELDDLKWHNKKLFEALKVPLSRMPNENVVMFGDDGGTTRDEINFQKFIDMLRKSFSEIFLTPLKINLIRTGIIDENDWEMNKEKIFVKFVENEYFKEKANIELMTSRANLVDALFPLIGKIYSYETVAIKFMKMTKEEYEDERAKIKLELQDETLYPPEEEEEDINSGSTTIKYKSDSRPKQDSEL